MSTASIKKIIPCKKNQLIEMVLDIDKYPEFVPWCLGGKVHSRKESIDLVEIKADLKVGKRIINETYTTLARTNFIRFDLARTNFACFKLLFRSCAYQPRAYQPYTH